MCIMGGARNVKSSPCVMALYILRAQADKGYAIYPEHDSPSNALFSWVQTSCIDSLSMTRRLIDTQLTNGFYKVN